MLVMGMTPFLIIISGKTNFISGITGVSYEKLNVFHQALGWGSLFLSLVHTIPFLVQDSLEGGAARLESRWHSRELYRNGVPPLVFLFLLCFCGLRFVRKYLYEVFWHTHWILALAYVGTLTWHIYGAMGVEYIWGSFGFWAAQMIYRTILKSPFIPNDYVFKHKNATVKALPNNLFEITVPIRNKFEFFWKPGQHLFVRFMSGVHTLDNHPFSIVTIPETSGGSTLKMMVRPHGGLTRKIYESVLKESTLEKNYKVFIDGPYGGMNRDPLAFDKLILVASGTGISVTLPFMLNVAKNLGDPSNEVQQVDFTWIIRHLDSLEWVKNQLIDLLNSILEKDEEFLSLFSINVFVTNSKDSLRPEIVKGNLHPIRSLGKEDIISNVPKLKDSSIKVNTSNFKEFVNIHHGQKPLLKDYVMSTSLLAKTAVIVSGTRSAQIDVGNAVSELQKEVIKAGSSIEEVYLHTENFGW
jgi:ferric-chelate reductase